MSTVMSIEALSDIMVTCAGGDLGANADISSTSFEDLGYDSLVLIETAAVLKRDYHIQIPDNELTELKTPKELLDKVNDLIEAAS